MKTAVIVFPGSNCDHDLYHAYKHVLKLETKFVWHEERSVEGFDLVLIPGGFSYGDYLRAGAIARFSPVMESVKAHIDRGGYALGICNGFQILTETHLLPGALVQNAGMKFVCDDIFIKRASAADTFVTAGVDDSPLKIPVAHMEGNYTADEVTLDRLEAEDRVIYRYCDKDGTITNESNPNGSARNIAGIISDNRRIAGMMPHPERVVEETVGGTDGLAILNAMTSLLSCVGVG